MTSARHRSTVGFTVWLVLLLMAAGARGESDGNRRVLAEALFQEGRQLLADGRIDSACKKLAESERLDPGGGTLLLLAVCHERQGLWATAEAEYRAALSMARRDRRADRERLAEKHLAAVEPKVSRVELRGAPMNATLVLDGVGLTREAVGVPLPIDPGAHRLAVRAPGREPWSTTFRVGKEPETLQIDVPELAPAEDDQRAPVSEPRTDRGAGSGRRLAGWITLGTGAAITSVGAIFGASAIGKNDEARALCEPASCNDSEALALNDLARTHATVANIAIGVGLTAVVAGVVLVLTAPRGANSRTLGTSSGTFTF